VSPSAPARKPSPDLAGRLARCRQLLGDIGLDAVLVSNAADVRYLSGFRGGDTLLVIAREAAPLICADSRYWSQVEEEVSGYDLVKVTTADPLGQVATAVAERIGASLALGFQGTSLSYAGHRRLRRRHAGRLRDVRERLSRLRALKDRYEIDTIRRACAIADEAVEAVVAEGLVGRSEADVAWALLVEYHRLGAEGEAFPAIVAAGDHGAQAHALPSARVIASGDLVVIDTGARLEGYCSDITRTVAAGQPQGWQVELYDVVREAQLAGLAAVRPGAHGRDDVDKACRRVIAAAGYGDAFGHGTGHGVGLEVHEAPSLGQKRGDTLAEGMVCTVEPGIYLPGQTGVRIEDTVLVTRSGCERLTTSDKDLRVVD